MNYGRYVVSASITSVMFMYARGYLFRSFLDNTNDLGWRIFLVLAFTGVATIFSLTKIGDTHQSWKKLLLFLCVFLIIQYLLQLYFTVHI